MARQEQAATSQPVPDWRLWPGDEAGLERQDLSSHWIGAGWGCLGPLGSGSSWEQRFGFILFFLLLF